jgi:nitrogen fixation/metabolism regulation signal transduction histidine kinase
LKDEIASAPEGNMKEGLVESLDSLEKNIIYINKIVSDLQDYARPIIPEIKETSLSSVFVDIFKTVNVPDSIELSINVKDSEKIKTDPMLLQRAFSNIVTKPFGYA